MTFLRKFAPAAVIAGVLCVAPVAASADNGLQATSVYAQGSPPTAIRGTVAVLDRQATSERVFVATHGLPASTPITLRVWTFSNPSACIGYAVLAMGTVCGGPNLGPACPNWKAIGLPSLPDPCNPATGFKVTTLSNITTSSATGRATIHAVVPTVNAPEAEVQLYLRITGIGSVQLAFFGAPSADYQAGGGDGSSHPSGD